MADTIRKLIQDAFLKIGSYGRGTRAGDYTLLLLPEEVEARLQKGSLISILSSSGHRLAYEYHCMCGTVSTVEVLDRDRVFPCSTCHENFSVRRLLDALVKRERIRQNKPKDQGGDGANIDLTKPSSPEELDFALAKLPTHVPSQVTTPAQRKAQQLKELFTEWNGEVGYDGDGPHTTSLGADNAFSDPFAARLGARSAPANAEYRALGDRSGAHSNPASDHDRKVEEWRRGKGY